VFVKTLATGAIQRINTDANGAQAVGDQGNNWSYGPVWSPDGQKIAFTSRATNLVPEYDGNGSDDVFVKTLATGAIQRVSASTSGTLGDGDSNWPVWSPDSAQIAFTSSAKNLVTGDTNNSQDVFVKTLATGAIQRINTDANGGQADASAYRIAWAPNAQKIAFVSEATNLVAGDSNQDGDVFVKTLATGAIQRINTDANGGQAAGEQGSGWDYAPAWSPDSTKVAFSSQASNLVPGDTNGTRDVFVKSLATGSVQLVSADTTAALGNSESNNPFWSPDGTKIGFDSEASNLVPGDTNTSRDVFVKTLS
jgi:Tol biopolymer transport system component